MGRGDRFAAPNHFYAAPGDMNLRQLRLRHIKLVKAGQTFSAKNQKGNPIFKGLLVLVLVYFYMEGLATVDS
jgi:hypothetical protein